MREEIRKIQELMEAAEYVTDAPVATSVYLATRLRKPLLIEGPAGVGKTETAKVLARMLGTNLIRLQCYEGLDAAAALYEWNYQKQILHIKLHESSGRRASDEEHEIFSEAFLLRRPLLQAISQPDQAPVLLVDEVDRCVTARTLVATTRGVRRADDIRAGDELVSFDPNAFTVARSFVKRVVPRTAESVLRVFVGGRVIEVTPEHKFIRYVGAGYEIVEAQRLRPGDRLPLHKPFYTGSLQNPDVAIDDEMVKLSDTARQRFYKAYKASGRTYESLAVEIGVSRQHLRNVIARTPCKDSLRSGPVSRLGRALGLDEAALWRCDEVRGLRITPSPVFYEVLGYIVADGCFTSDRLCIADKDRQNVDLYAAKFETAFRRTARVVKGPHNNFEVSCHSRPLGRFLKRLLGPGIVRSRDRQAPAFVFDLPAEERAAFLRGYFDGEGWVGDHQVAAVSASLYLLIGVQWLLASLGIDSHISPASDTGFGLGRPYYTLALTDTARFSLLVGFCSPAKRAKLGGGRRPQWSTTSYLPETAVHPALRRIREGVVLHRTRGHQTIYDILARGVKPNVGPIRRLAAQFDAEELRGLLGKEVVLSEVSRIETVPGEQPVFDFVLADSPYFVANQIVTHNCDEEFEAFMLEIFSDWQVTIPEIGTIKASHPPYVVLTSNRTRELSDALRRRCLYLWIDYPDFDKEVRIVQLKVPALNESLAREVTRFMESLRRMRLAKVPGVAETLDWAQALAALHADHLDEAIVSETIGAVLKDADDIKRFRAEIARSGLGPLLATP